MTANSQKAESEGEETNRDQESFTTFEDRPSVSDLIRASFLAEMSSSTTMTTKEWTTPASRTVEGQQKGPDSRAETHRTQRQEQDIQFLTPSFKTAPIALSPGSGLSSSFRETGDYRVEERQQHYKLNIIDPKVSSHAYIPAATLPSVDRKRYKTPDFPSAHSKRSFLKLAPLEQRRIRSVETRSVAPNSYLTESLERHRAMLASPLKDELKVKEKEVLKPWEKPDRPGHKVGEDLHSFKSETIIHSQKGHGMSRVPSALFRASSALGTVAEDGEEPTTSDHHSPQRLTWLRTSPGALYHNDRASSEREALEPGQLGPWTPSPTSVSPNHVPLQQWQLHGSSAEGNIIQDRRLRYVESVREWESRGRRSARRLRHSQSAPRSAVLYYSASPAPSAQDIADLGPTIAVYDPQATRRRSLVRNRRYRGSLAQQSSAYSNSTLERSHTNLQASETLALARVASGVAGHAVPHMDSGPRTPASAGYHSLDRSNPPWTPQGGVRGGTSSDSIGMYTQLDQPPQQGIYENQPLRWALENPYDHRLYADDSPLPPPPPPVSILRKPSDARYSEFREESRRSGKVWHGTQDIAWEAPNSSSSAYVHSTRPASRSQQSLQPSDSQLSFGETRHRLSLSQHQLQSLGSQEIVMRNLEALRPRTPTQPAHSTAPFTGPDPYIGDGVRAAPPPPPPKPILANPLPPPLQQEFYPPPPPPNAHFTEQSEQRVTLATSYTEEVRRKEWELEEQMRREELLRLQRLRLEEEEAHIRRLRDEEERRLHIERERRLHLLKEQERRATTPQPTATFPPPPPQPPRPASTLPRPSYYQPPTPAPSGPPKLQPFAADPNAGAPTWKRSYVVDAPKDGDILKNAIVGSDQILHDEQYYIDLMARRDTFIEKPKPPPEILRLGKVWQPPPEKPYVFPTRNQNKEWVPADDKRHMWEPYLLEPEYKYERKNFTPEPSPPPRRRSFRKQPGPLPQTLPHPHHHPNPAERAPSVLEPLPPDAIGGPRPDGNIDVRVRVIPPPQQGRQPPPPPPPPHHSRPQSALSDMSLMYASEPNLRGPSPAPHRQQPLRGATPLLNEPTPRHVSTLPSPRPNPAVSVRNRLNAFENAQAPPPPDTSYRLKTGPIQGEMAYVRRRGSTPDPSSRGATPHQRRSVASTLSLDEDWGEGGRAVRFADRSSVLQHPATQPLDVFIREEGAKGHLPQYGGPLLQSAAQQYSHNSGQHPPTTHPNQTMPIVTTPKRNSELEELGRLRQELLDRAQRRDDDYKGRPPEIHKEEAHKERHASPQRQNYVETTVTQLSSDLSSPLHNRHTASSNELASESVATWQFSQQSFSPRSVVSINGGQRDDPGLLRVRTDLSPQRQPAVLVPIQTRASGSPTRVSHEFRQERSLERYHGGGGTLISLRDERSKPKSIMKTANAQQIVLPVTEQIQQVEETKRTEEIERRIHRKEKKKRGSRHAHRERQWSHSGGYDDENPWQQQGEEKVVIEKVDVSVTAEEGRRQPSPTKALPRPIPASSSKLSQAVEKRSSAAQVDDLPLPEPIVVPYTVSYGQWRGNGYAGGTTDERYQRQTTTKRQSGHESSNYGTASRSLGSGGAHQRQSSLTDSLRRQKATYLPVSHSPIFSAFNEAQPNWQNGDVRVGSGMSGGRSKVTKSRSSRDVYHNELADDFYGGPIVEFPPTLPRGKAYVGGNSSMSRHSRQSGGGVSGGGVSGGELRKTRSFADWEREGPRDMTVAPRWEDSYMTQLERDFRDSLLMPLPDGGQKVNEREFREEDVPGGHESLLKEVSAHSGRKPTDPRHPNSVTDYSEAKQEFHYKKETGPGEGRRR